jgi:hypothetical protein
VGCSRPAREPGELEDCGPSEGFASWVSPTLTIAPTRRATVGFDGTQATGGQSFFVEIAGTGCLVAFTSEATNLVEGDTNGVADVFVRGHSVKRWRRRTFKALAVDSRRLESAGPCTKTSWSWLARPFIFNGNIQTPRAPCRVRVVLSISRSEGGVPP